MIGFIRMALIACLVWAGSAHAAGRVFYDDFEDGTMNAWAPGESSGYYAKCDSVTSSLDGLAGPHGGSRMARCNWDGTQGTYGHRSQEMIKSGWSKSRESFIRFWVRADNDIDYSQGSKLFRAPGAISYAAIQFEDGPSANLFSVIYKSNDQQIGTTNWGCGPALRGASWHKFEIYFLESTSGQNNGTARIWIDDGLCWEAVNVNTDDPQGAGYWAEFHVMSNWSIGHPEWVNQGNHDANNHVYWDDFEIFSDTGSGGTGSMSAGTITQGGPVSADLAGAVTVVSTVHAALTGQSNLSGAVSAITSVYGTASAGSDVAMNECASPPPGTVFCADFEEASDALRRAEWDDYDGALDVNFLNTDPGPSVTAGNHVAQFRVAPGQSGAADLVKVLSSSYDKLYARWFVKYETGFNFSAPLHGGGLALGDRNWLGNSGIKPDGTNFDYFAIQHQNSTPYNKALYAYSYYPGMYQDCGPPGSCFGDSLPCVYDNGASYCTVPADRPQSTPPTVAENTWVCVESMIDAGTTGATGQIQLWQDGVSLGQFNNVNIRSTTALKIENLWLSLFHHDGTHSTAGQLFDNIVVSTQRIGCSAVGAPSSIDLQGAASASSIISGSAYIPLPAPATFERRAR